jgi:DNA-binding response OmpR family regulator
MALIVVMEDDAGTRMMVASVLKRDGHVVLGAEDARRAWTLVRQSSPELIISDVQMPGMNGFQMLASLRQDRPNAATPSSCSPRCRSARTCRIGMTTGADDYITKPFRPDELRAAVAAQLNKRETQASLRSMPWMPPSKWRWSNRSTSCPSCMSSASRRN